MAKKFFLDFKKMQLKNSTKTFKMSKNEITQEKINNFYNELLGQNQKRGYFLNPDQEFTKGLLEGLLVNEERYGYQACPCRLSSGKKEEDLDIICPCYYRDPDLSEFGNCYCGLYVSKNIKEGKNQIKPIPERRPNKEARLKMKEEKNENSKKEIGGLDYPVWRCEVCGYICALDEAPDICPICGATKERFSRFM